MATEKKVKVFIAKLRCVGRIMGLESTIRFGAESLEDAKAQADSYVYRNRDRFSRVLQVKAE